MATDQYLRVAGRTIGRVNTKAIGEISEAVILAEFLRAGFPVLLPFGDNQRYDMVVEADGGFLRVQCKTARRIQGGAVLCFSAHSGVWGVGDRAVSRKQPYRGEADLFAVYSPDTRQVYILEVGQVPVTDVWMRLEPVRNNQRARIRHAEEHTLQAWAARRGAAHSSAKNAP